jgi:RNA recognition motif-containing protein
MAGKTTFAPNQSVKIEKRYKNLAIMAGQLKRPANVRLPPDVNRILYIKNLPYKITAEEMYDIFGKYGALRQIRV